MLALLATALLAGVDPVAAQDNDDGAPTLADAERANVTAIQVTIADDSDVDAETIDVEDFAVSAGEIKAVNVTEQGSNAEVLVMFTDRLMVDEVTVSIADGGNVTDTEGNALREGSVTVSGMDSFVPQLREFDVQRVNHTAAQITVGTSEELSALRVAVDGPTSTNLTLDRFESVAAPYEKRYVTRYRFPADGAYEVHLASMTDTANLTVNRTDAHTFVRDDGAPTAAFEGPRNVHAGDRAAFDGSGSADDVGVHRYEWAVDGEPVANVSGEAENASRFEAVFDDPGTRTVTLTTADARGNTDSASVNVTVHEAVAKDDVEVRDADGNVVHATVGTNRTGARVRVADAYGRLVAADGVTLRSLVVGLPTDEAATLNVSANASVAAFENATGRPGLAAFTVEPGNHTFERPTFRFAVSPERLSRAGVSYADVALYRDDGNWSELDTDVVRATSTAVVYEAESPSFSTFVVGSTGASGDGSTAVGDPSIAVIDATLQREAVAFGDLAVVEATFENTGTATGTEVVNVTRDGEIVATRSVTVPAGESRDVEFSVPAVTDGTVTVDGVAAGELTVTDGAGAANGSGTETAGGADGATGEAAGGFDLGDVPIPNPLALWPGGLVGTILQALVGLVVVTYGVLKALAIYLGY